MKQEEEIYFDSKRNLVVSKIGKETLDIKLGEFYIGGNNVFGSRVISKVIEFLGQEALCISYDEDMEEYLIHAVDYEDFLLCYELLEDESLKFKVTDKKIGNTNSRIGLRTTNELKGVPKED